MNQPTKVAKPSLPIAHVSSDILKVREDKRNANLIVAHATNKRQAERHLLKIMPKYKMVGMVLHVQLVPADSPVNHCGEAFWQYYICEPERLDW